MASSVTSIVKPRDVKFDGLRTIGLLAIILAHVNPPSVLFQLRNFDVPLMVLISGAVYGLSSSSHKKYVSYIWGRVNRLLIPTWIFLSIFFLLGLVFHTYYAQQTVLESFLLLNGIGYVWIIRVFILVALIAPFFVYLYHKIHNKNLYLLSVLCTYVLFLAINHFYRASPLLRSPSAVDFIFQNIIFYLLPFGAVAGLGLYVVHASKKSIVGLLIFFSGIFTILAYKYAEVHHHFVPTQVYKYPPGIYYLSFALAMSLLLYLLSFTNLFQKIFQTRFMQFFSASSLWIYLWQIFFLYQWKIFQKYVPTMFENFISEYIFVVLLAVLFTFLQKRLIASLVDRLQQQGWKTFLSVSFLK